MPASDPYTAPQFSRSALVTIDMQVDFLDGGTAVIAGTSAILPRLQAVVEAFRHAGRPIVHVVRIYPPDGRDVDPCRRAAIEGGASIVRPGTPGLELPSSLVGGRTVTLDSPRLLNGELQLLGPMEWALFKPRWGAFFRTGLDDHLTTLGVTTLVVGGCNFPNCPRATIYEASERDYRIVLADDAVSGVYEQGRQELRNIGVALMPAAAIVDAFDTVRAEP